METETTVQTDSILARLKARTAHQHQQTEDGVDLMSEDFSREDYRNLLVKFYAFYKSFESKMHVAVCENPIDLEYPERLNSPKLLADLTNLEMTEGEIGAVKTFDELPVLDSKEEIFGSLYVIEGSTLGGQYISRHLKEKFGLDETNGVAFFSGYGKETGKMWNTFREKITEFAETSRNHEAIIKSANATFEKIGKASAQM